MAKAGSVLEINVSEDESNKLFHRVEGTMNRFKCLIKDNGTGYTLWESKNRVSKIRLDQIRLALQILDSSLTVTIRE